MTLAVERQRIGDRVRVQREAEGLSRERLGARAGLSQVTIYNVENGKAVKYDTLAQIAEALGVGVADLVEDIDQR